MPWLLVALNGCKTREHQHKAALPEPMLNRIGVKGALSDAVLCHGQRLMQSPTKTRDHLYIERTFVRTTTEATKRHLLHSEGADQPIDSYVKKRGLANPPLLACLLWQ